MNLELKDTQVNHEIGKLQFAPIIQRKHPTKIYHRKMFQNNLKPLQQFSTGEKSRPVQIIKVGSK